MRPKTFLLILIIFNCFNKIFAQDTSKAVTKDTSGGASQNASDLMNDLEKETANNKTVYTTGTFKYTRIINGQSVENLPANVLDVRISHRFGPLSAGAYEFFGLDYSPFNVRIGFDYGITNNFMIGVGHNAWQKTYDAFFKLKILRQSKGTVKMPFTISFVPTVAINTVKQGGYGFDLSDSGTKIDRASYVLQLLIARKFSEGTSLQVMPTYIHADNISFNHFKNTTYKRNILAIGIGGTQKISKRMSLNAEYYYQLPDSKAASSSDVASFGIDIGTGGHVFQLHFTNSFGLTEKSFISETSKLNKDNDLRFGFNISRVFQLGKKGREKKDWEKK
jgi:Membrane bound beta barrel domain (DUF5777)